MPHHARQRNARSRKHSKHHSPRSSHCPNPSNDLPDLKPHSYLGRQLTQLIIKTASIPVQEKLTRSEYSIFCEIPSAFKTYNDAHRYIDSIIPLLDKTYFYSSVEKRIRGHARAWWDTDNCNMSFNAKHITSRETGLLIFKVAHAMLHTWVSEYSCECRKCARRRRRPEVEGNGHGRVWCDAMIEIQDAMGRDLGRSGATGCNIIGAVSREIIESGWRPTEEELRRWGVEDLEVVSIPRTYDGDDDSDDSDDSDDDDEYGGSTKVLCCSVM